MAANSTSGLIDQCVFEAYLNGRYHADREGFLAGWHRRLMIFIILFGAAQLVDQFTDDAKRWIGVATLAAGLIDLFFDLSGRAQRHAYLREKYFDVAALVREDGADARSARVALDKLAGQEEPIFCVTHLIAERWAHTAVYGSPRDSTSPGWFKRLLRNYYRFDG